MRSLNLVLGSALVLLLACWTESAVAAKGQKSNSKGATLAIDFGSQSIRFATSASSTAAAQIGFNSMGERSIPALLAFHESGDRLLAEQSGSVLRQKPELVLQRPRSLVQTSNLANVTDPAEMFAEVFGSTATSYLPSSLVVADEKRGTVRVLLPNVPDLQSFTSEEVLAMLFGHARDCANTANPDTKFQQAVITVPPWFSQSQRRAVADAADIAGLDLLGLVSEPVAVAVQYGKLHDFAANPKRNSPGQRALFFSVSASGAWAALVQYRLDRRGGRQYNTADIKGLEWDQSVGGQLLEDRLLQHLADVFDQQGGADATCPAGGAGAECGGPITTSLRGMSELAAAAKKAKLVLSANAEAHIDLRSLHAGRDFQHTVTREAYEALVEKDLSKAVDVLKRLLIGLKMKHDDVGALELVGGATRTPKLQALVSHLFGSRTPGSRLDKDEAPVLGAALAAANFTTRAGLAHCVQMADVAPRPLYITIHNPGAAQPQMGPQLLVERLAQLPWKRTIALSNISIAELTKEELVVVLAHKQQDGDPSTPRSESKPVAGAFRVSGLKDAWSKHRAAEDLVDVNLKLKVSPSGLAKLEAADLVVKVATSEKPKKDKKDKKDKEEKKEKEKKLKSSTEKLKVEAVAAGKHVPRSQVLAMTPPERAAAKSTLSALARRDAARKEKEEAHNALEAQVFDIRQRLDDLDERIAAAAAPSNDSGAEDGGEAAEAEAEEAGGGGEEEAEAEAEVAEEAGGEEGKDSSLEVDPALRAALVELVEETEAWLAQTDWKTPPVDFRARGLKLQRAAEDFFPPEPEPEPEPEVEVEEPRRSRRSSQASEETSASEPASADSSEVEQLRAEVAALTQRMNELEDWTRMSIDALVQQIAGSASAAEE